MDLGLALGVSEAIFFNISYDFRWNKDRGCAVLMPWKAQHGNNATMESLAVVLDGIGRKDLVHRLLGMSSYQCVNQALA